VRNVTRLPFCESMINRFHLVGPSSDGQQLTWCCLLEEMKTRRDALLVSHGAGARPSSNSSAMDQLGPCLHPGCDIALGRERRSNPAASLIMQIPSSNKRGVHNAQMRKLECWMRNRRRCSRLSIHHQCQQIQHWRLYGRVFPRWFPIAAKNSICSDYLTEKFYRALEMSLEISPLVYGGANYSRDLRPAQFLHPGRRFPVASSPGRLPAPPGAQPSPLRQIPGHWTKD
jgi:hypothetical protein